MSQGVVVSTSVPAGAGGAGSVTLDFADTDIREVAAQILGNTLHVNYTIDPAVHGTATLRTVTPLANSQLVPVSAVVAGAERRDIGAIGRCLSRSADRGGKRYRRRGWYCGRTDGAAAFCVGRGPGQGAAALCAGGLARGRGADGERLGDFGRAGTAGRA